jgi:hypothetical protein
MGRRSSLNLEKLARRSSARLRRAELSLHDWGVAAVVRESFGPSHMIRRIRTRFVSAIQKRRLSRVKHEATS